MKAKVRLVSLVLVMFLFLNLSIGVFAGSDMGTTRPESNPIVSPCGGDMGTTRPE